MATFFLIWHRASCELYTAVAELEKLVDTEGKLVNLLGKYIASEEERLGNLRRLEGQLSSLHEEASDARFLANPVNSFLLVKRLTRDWNRLWEMIDTNHSAGVFASVSKELPFPDEEDLKGAVVALLRLQDTYKLNASQLSRGILSNSKTHKQLTAADCYELARQAYLAQNHHHTVLWAEEARRKWFQESDSENELLAEILEHLAFSLYKTGRVEEALRTTEELLALKPFHEVARGNIAHYERMLQKRGEEGGIDGVAPAEEEGAQVEQDLYRALCRGETTASDRDLAKLRCRYFHGHHPFLRLAPVLEEEVFAHPRILVYRHFLSDSEIETVKQLALPKLKRATVQNQFSGELETANYRISKSSWLKDEEHPAISKISQRIEDVTGLNMRSSEELQVVNYGIGGHYEPHFDHARPHETNAFKSLGLGNRIATWLNYMSDVDAGGATVFPALGITLFPEKGSSVFWYNLLKNGDGDELTRHAACPVLLGTKWVSNKWIHEYGQEFRRPCHPNPKE